MHRLFMRKLRRRRILFGVLGVKIGNFRVSAIRKTLWFSKIREKKSGSQIFLRAKKVRQPYFGCQEKTLAWNDGKGPRGSCPRAFARVGHN